MPTGVCGMLGDAVGDGDVLDVVGFFLGGGFAAADGGALEKANTTL